MKIITFLIILILCRLLEYSIQGTIIISSGCEGYCNRGPSAPCFACRMGISVEDFCADSTNADIPGCDFFGQFQGMVNIYTS